MASFSGPCDIKMRIDQARKFPSCPHLKTLAWPEEHLVEVLGFPGIRHPKEKEKHMPSAIPT